LQNKGLRETSLATFREALPAAARLALLRPGDYESAAQEGILYDGMAANLQLVASTEAIASSNRSLEIAARLATRFPQNEDAAEQLASVYSRLGNLYGVIADFEHAMSALKQSIVLRERLAAAHPNDMVHRRDLMLAYAHIAGYLGSSLLPNMGDFDGARRYFRKMMVIAGESAKADPSNRTAQYDLAAALVRYGSVRAEVYQAAESLSQLERARAILQELEHTAPEDLRFKRELAIIEEFAGEHLLALGRREEGLAQFRKSLARAEAMLAQTPGYRPAIAQALAARRRLALAFAAAGAREEALFEARRSVEDARAWLNLHIDASRLKTYFAEAWVTLGRVHLELAKHRTARPGDRAEALAAAGQALAACPSSRISEQVRKQASQLLEEARLAVTHR
jgi:tetratricopeptide (TPR) repeat protein